MHCGHAQHELDAEQHEGEHDADHADDERRAGVAPRANHVPDGVGAVRRHCNETLTQLGHTDSSSAEGPE